MKKKRKKIIIGLISITVVIALAIVGITVYFSNYNYLIVASKYMGYELGYEEVNISNKSLLSPLMKDISTVIIDSDLKTNKEAYEYTESSGIVVTKGMNLLEMGKYSLDASEGSQKDTIIVSVYDTMPPEHKNFRQEIVVKQGIPVEQLVQYFHIFDYDYDATIGILVENFDSSKTGKQKVRVLAFDSSGNRTERYLCTVNVVSEKQIKKQHLKVSDTFYEGSTMPLYKIFKTEKELNEYESLLDETRAQVIQLEENYKKEVLKEDIDAYSTIKKKKEDIVNSKYEKITYIEDDDNIAEIKEEVKKETKKKEEKKKAPNTQSSNPTIPEKTETATKNKTKTKPTTQTITPIEEETPKNQGSNTSVVSKRGTSTNVTTTSIDYSLNRLSIVVGASPDSISTKKIAKNNLTVEPFMITSDKEIKRYPRSGSVIENWLGMQVVEVTNTTAKVVFYDYTVMTKRGNESSQNVWTCSTRVYVTDSSNNRVLKGSITPANGTWNRDNVPMGAVPDAKTSVAHPFYENDLRYCKSNPVEIDLPTGNEAVSYTFDFTDEYLQGFNASTAERERPDVFGRKYDPYICLKLWHENN